MTYEMLSTTGSLYVKGGYQVANSPMVASDWSSTTAFGEEQTAAGIRYGTTFSSLSTSKEYVRFGYACKNYASVTDSRAAQMSSRIDFRRP